MSKEPRTITVELKVGYGAGIANYKAIRAQLSKGENLIIDDDESDCEYFEERNAIWVTR